MTRGRRSRRRGPAPARPLLERLERSRLGFGGEAEADKLALLEGLRRRRLATAAEVLRLHDVLCFMRAYPDGPLVLGAVERMLADFPLRPDLRRHRAALGDSGIAGTAIEFRFFWPTAAWLARRWGRSLSIVWGDFDRRDQLADLLPLLTLYGETPALDEIDYSPREWLARLKGPAETNAGFLVRRFAALPMDGFAREKIYDQLDPPLRITPGPNSPSRTHAHHRTGAIAFQTRALDRGRLDLDAELRRAPRSVRAASRAEGRALIDLARVSMGHPQPRPRRLLVGRSR